MGWQMLLGGCTSGSRTRGKGGELKRRQEERDPWAHEVFALESVEVLKEDGSESGRLGDELFWKEERERSNAEESEGETEGVGQLGLQRNS